MSPCFQFVLSFENQEVDRFQDMQADLKPRGYSGIWKVTYTMFSFFGVIIWNLVYPAWSLMHLVLVIAYWTSRADFCFAFCFRESVSLDFGVNWTLKLVKDIY